jgi:glycerol-3-phosphate acyltransferase PlsY
MMQELVMEYWWQLLILAAASYCAGNFCAAIFVSKKFVKKDIRQHGSKNPGTTNMARVFGIKFGIITLVIDFLKGLICAAAGKVLFTYIGGPELGSLAGYFASLAVIAGHIYPVFLGFKGGKGFASGAGALIVLNPLFTLAALAVGIVLLIIVDRMSVFALAFFLAQAVYHIFVYGQEYWPITLCAILYLILSVISHRGNIVRLIRGEENRLHFIKMIKRDPKPSSPN